MVTFHSYVKLPEGIQIDFIGMTSGNMKAGHQSFFLISDRGVPPKSVLKTNPIMVPPTGTGNTRPPLPADMKEFFNLDIPAGP